MADGWEVAIGTKSGIVCDVGTTSAAVKRSIVFCGKERMIDMKKISARTLAKGALLIALNIVITRFLAINFGAVRISFTFLPIAIGSLMFGGVTGAILALIADVLGMLMSGGLPWLGFCVSTVLYGLSYGILYGKELTYKRLLPLMIVQAIVIDSFLGAVWFNVHAGMPFLASLTERSINALVMIPVKTFVIKYVWKIIGDKI